jgi:hypothetical protein
MPSITIPKAFFQGAGNKAPLGVFRCKRCWLRFKLNQLAILVRGRTKPTRIRVGLCRSTCVHGDL